MSDSSSTGFLESLFDFSFKSFVTPKLVAVIYGLMLVGGCLVTLVFIIGGFSQGAMSGITALILSPIVLLLYVIGARVYMELIIVAFKCVEHLRKISENTDRA